MNDTQRVAAAIETATADWVGAWLRTGGIDPKTLTRGGVYVPGRDEYLECAQAAALRMTYGALEGVDE